MPALSTITLFLLVAVGLLLIPGPSVLCILTRSAAQGRRAGLASVGGIELASLMPWQRRLDSRISWSSAQLIQAPAATPPSFAVPNPVFREIEPEYSESIRCTRRHGAWWRRGFDAH